MGRRLIGAAFLFFIMSLAASNTGWAQIVPSDTESLIVVPVTVPKVPGTVFSIAITLANRRSITGISGRLVFDRNLIAPIIVDSLVDTLRDTVFYTYSMDRVGRGLALSAFNAGNAGPGASGFLMFSLVPSEKINPGNGPICQLNFTVKAARDTTICIQLLNDPDPAGLKNGLADSVGSLIIPTVLAGGLKIGAGSPGAPCATDTTTGKGNNPPFINPIAARSIEQGSILSFMVVASDPNGDNVTLSATTLPQNAAFNTVTGDSVVSGTFTFSPSLSQVGNFTADFRAVDDSGKSATRSVTITVTEVLKDVLFSSSVTGKAPTGAIPGKRFALFPIDLTARGKVYGINFDLKYDRTVIQVDSIIPTGRLKNLIFDFRTLPGQADRIRFLIFSLQGDSIGTASTPAIMYLALSVSSAALPGITDVVIDSGWEVTRVGATSQPLLTQSGEFFIDRFGDATGDAHIDVADVVALVGFILGNYSFSVRQFDAANTNQDSVANIVDLVNIINLIFGTPLPPPAPRYIGPPAGLALNARPFAFNSSEPIKLEAELPAAIAGVQVHVNYNPAEVRLDAPQKTAVTNGLILKYLENAPGRMSFVLYNMGNSQNEIPSGKTTILEIPATRLSGIGDTIPPKLTITRAFLSSGKGEGIPVAGVGANVPRQFELSQNYPNPFNPKTTIRFKIAAADGDGSPVPVKLEVFNILGQSVKTLIDDRRTPGSYTLEWDGTDAGGSRVSSGIYLYRLTSKEFSVTKKMVFLK